ncbi:MAG: hypothetical protein AAFY00_01290 [Bacteroidota bacterium]
MSLVESPHEQGVLYAGTDDGLLHITKNGGNDWENITPSNIGAGIINSIEVSPHNPSTAYVAVMRYKSMDLKPYVFKTTDYGATWTKITNGINDKHTFVRAVREDKKREGLLYAGTETGLYISFDDGLNWQKFQLNLPVVPINDLTIQDNDLVVATAGRSFWILDDLSTLQNSSGNENSLVLFPPKDTYLIFGSSQEKPVPGLGQNPKSGVIFDYYLPKDADSLDLKLEVLQNGKVIRTITNKKPKDFKPWPGGPPKPVVLPSKKGFNRFAWDFRKKQIPAIDKVFVFGNYNGSRVGPGDFTLRLTLEGETVETQTKVLANPRIEASPADYSEQQQMLNQIENAITSMHEAVNQMRSAKKQLLSYKALLRENESAEELVKLGDSLVKRIKTWEEKLIQPNQKTFQDVINFHNQLNADFMHLKGFVDVAEPKVTKGAKERLNDLLKQWSTFENEKKAIVDNEMAKFNSTYQQLKLPAILLDD